MDVALAIVIIYVYKGRGLGRGGDIIGVDPRAGGFFLVSLGSRFRVCFRAAF